MASYGDASRFSRGFDHLVKLMPEGRYRTVSTAMVFQPGYSNAMLNHILGIKPRHPDEPLSQIHFDLAAGLQAITERVVFHLLHFLRAQSPMNNLCLAGGVFQNSVLNGKILRSGLFSNVHVPPVPGDHGGALGAALYVYHEQSGSPRNDIGFSVFSGPQYTDAEMRLAFEQHTPVVRYTRPESVAAKAARLLASGKVIGWFQGRMEYGPRALGHRSILASPLSESMKNLVNDRIKHRERFRPFAGAVPLEHSHEYFEMDSPSPYMQFVVPVRPEAINRIPAVVHFGTCRAQTVDSAGDPLFHSLLLEFGKLTGCPVLLNTSFNDADEPIVCSPGDALRTFSRTNLDALAIGPFIVER